MFDQAEGKVKKNQRDLVLHMQGHEKGLIKCLGLKRKIIKSVVET